MVQLRISIVFVALNAFFAAYALPVEVIGLSAMQSRQLPQSPPIVGQDDLRVPPQARAWEKRQRNRQGPGSGPIPEQVQAPAPQAARPNTNTNAQPNRRPPPQARNIGVVMRSLIANEGLAPEDIQLRNLQERQSVQPFPKQNDPTPPPPELARQPPLPQTPGRLMKMEERRQVGRQEQKPQDQPPQDQNNQARSPNPSLTLPATDDGNARPADGQRPRIASRLFARQSQDGNKSSDEKEASPPPVFNITTMPLQMAETEL